VSAPASTPAARRSLALALTRLDERSRTLLALSRLDGLSTSEIAAVLYTTPQQVSRELAIARRALERVAPVRRQSA